jgi:H+/Cl- antiporter ClcA
MDTDSWQFGMFVLWSVVAVGGVVAGALAMSIESLDGLCPDAARGYFKFMGQMLIWPLAVVAFMFHGILCGIRAIQREVKYR